MSQQPTQICDNCLKPFPESKIATHFGYCRRNIKKCAQCGEMYDINFQEDHEEEFHKMSSCKYCKKQFKPTQISKHEQKCESRTHYCEYCDLDVPTRDYPWHLRQCEARTKQCDKCRKPIANKDFLIHTISCPGYVEETKVSSPQYQDYIQYLKEQKKKEELKRNDYRPSYQEPKREASRGRETRQEQGYSSKQLPGNNKQISGNNNYGLRAAQIRKQVIIPNKPTTNQSSKIPNYADIKMNKNAVNYGDQRIPASNIHQKDLLPKIDSNKNIDFSKNIADTNKQIGSGKVIENKYVPSVRPANEYKPSVNTYGVGSREVPRTVVQPSTNNVRSYQQHQMDVNARQGQQVPSSNYPKAHDPYKRQVPASNKEVYARREQKPKQVPRKQPEYQFRKQETRKYQQSSLNMPKQTVIPAQQYNAYQPSQYVPQQHYSHNTGVNDHEMDEELQKAIIASLGNMNVGSPKQTNFKQSKPSYKIDEIPPQFLENDLMNQSFYGKQQALWEEFEKNKKRR